MKYIDNIISVIRDNNGLHHNLENCFCYRIYNSNENKLQVILSDKEISEINLINGKNIVIIFSNNENEQNKYSKAEYSDKQLVQYVYYCNNLSIDDFRVINKAIGEIEDINEFVNPL